MLIPPPIDLPERFPPIEALLEISMDTTAQIKEKIAQLTKQLEKLKIEGMIRDIAALYGVDGDKAVLLAKRESSLNPLAVNVNKDKQRSRDRGLWQWNDFFHKNISDETAFDPELSTQLAMKAISEGKARMWVAAKGIFYDAV